MDSIICHYHAPVFQNYCFPNHLLLSSLRKTSSLLPVDNRSWSESLSFLGLRKLSYVMATGTLTANPAPARGVIYTVGDFMSGKEYLHAVKPTTTVEKALENLVENRITRFPVIDDDWKLFYSLPLNFSESKAIFQAMIRWMFPEVDSGWKVGKVVGELMTPAPLVIRETTNLEDAARLLLETKYRRLPAVDAEGKLVGIITRGDVVREQL